MSISIDDWSRPVRDLIAKNHNHGGFLVILPEYRPDLCKTLAYSLELDFFDVRTELLAPLGWRVHTLSLDALDITLQDLTLVNGVLIHNVEALLATKSGNERNSWLQRFAAYDWQHPAILPLAIYADEIPADLPRCYAFQPNGLPERSLLSQFLM